MNAKFKPGDRVKFTRAGRPERTCTGTIVEILPGYTDVYDGGEPYTIDDAAIVAIHNPAPEWWPYPYSLKFAPDLSELEIQEGSNTP